MNKLKEIKAEILSNPEVIEIMENKSVKDIATLHFGLGMYIRNRYLWGNAETIQILKEYYKVESVDDISWEIIKDLYKELKK